MLICTFFWDYNNIDNPSIEGAQQIILFVQISVFFFAILYELLFQIKVLFFLLKQIYLADKESMTNNANDDQIISSIRLRPVKKSTIIVNELGLKAAKFKNIHNNIKSFQK